MNPYRKGEPRTLPARRSFDPAYCKRCAARPSVNDGYIPAPKSAPDGGRPGKAIAPIETAVRQRGTQAFIMPV